MSYFKRKIKEALDEIEEEELRAQARERAQEPDHVHSPECTIPPGIAFTAQLRTIALSEAIRSWGEYGVKDNQEEMLRTANRFVHFLQNGT